MPWAPAEETRAAVKFWLDCLQALTVIVAIIGTALTAVQYFDAQEKAALAQEERLVEQARQERERETALKLQLEAPYRERKLDLYLEASRVVAHIAATPSIEEDKYRSRFWELYWGELAFVESTVEGEAKGGPKPSIERLMVEFCGIAFPEECPARQAAGADAPKTIEQAAIRLARQASKEIRDDWKAIGGAASTVRAPD